MTVIAPENSQEDTLKQVQIDPSVDPNLTQQSQDKQNDENFKAFREGRKKDRLEREAAEKRAAEKEAEAAALKAALEATFSAKSITPSAYQQHQYVELTEENEDQKIEKKVNAIIAQREAIAERTRMEREMQEYPTRLARDLPDFHHVISQENRDYLDYHYPEIARPLGRLQDGYDKWHDIYHAIKKLVPNNTTAKKELAKADINQNKPRSISSPTLAQPSPPTSAHILSEERKAANWARMQASLKGVGNG
jgi:hypothetical protein